MAIFKRETLIEKLAREAAWLVAEREGDRYWLSPTDQGPLHYVKVRYHDQAACLSFQCWLSVRFPLDNPPSGLFGRLLLRNLELRYASWAMDIGASCEASPCVIACIPLPALTADLFDWVCREIVQEVRDFRQELRDKFRYDLGEPASPATAAATPGKGGVPVIRPGGGIRYVE